MRVRFVFQQYGNVLNPVNSWKTVVTIAIEFNWMKLWTVTKVHGNVESMEGRYIQVPMLSVCQRLGKCLEKKKKQNKTDQKPAKYCELLSEDKVIKMMFQSIKRKKRPQRPSILFCFF